MIRQFWLTNEKGEEWNLRPYSTSMLSNPKGTSEGVGARTYWQGKRAFVQTNYRDLQSSITSVINFKNSETLTNFEQYIHRSEELFLHCARNGVPERYCKCEVIITDRPEDFAGWVMCSVTFRRLNPWRNPAKSETKSVSSVVSTKFQAPGNGSLGSAFNLRITPSSSFTGTIAVSDGKGTISLLSITVSANVTLSISSIEGEQAVYNGTTDIYDKINFSASAFFDIEPGADLTISFGASFTGSLVLETFDQWNEA